MYPMSPDIDHADGAKTPSSIASSPRGRDRPSPPQPPSSPTPPTPPPLSHLLHDLWLTARHARRNTDGLHGVLHIVHAHTTQLHAELAAFSEQVCRQQQATEIRLMEKDCEIRIAQAEAASYSMTAKARSATVLSLQRYVYCWFFITSVVRISTSSHYTIPYTVHMLR